MIKIVADGNEIVEFKYLYDKTTGPIDDSNKEYNKELYNRRLN